MYNEIQRKLTSLTLMTIMLAGGMAIAAPGMEPAHAANPNLFVSAEQVGNFAGIQVIEIKVTDSKRDEINTAQGRPLVELNNKKVAMIQGDDGSWYAYVAQHSTGSAGDEAKKIYGNPNTLTLGQSQSDAKAIWNGTSSFLPKAVSLPSSNVNYLPDLDVKSWPFIQTYTIADGSNVIISYGSGSSKQSTTLKYDYDDTKDISLDRQNYPAGSDIFITLDDSLLNLSPVGDDYWKFVKVGTDWKSYHSVGTNSASFNEVSFTDVGFENVKFALNQGEYNGENIFVVRDNGIIESVTSDVFLRESNTDSNIFVNYDRSDISNLVMNTNNKIRGDASIIYNTNKAHSILMTTFDGKIAFDTPATEEWLSGVGLGISLTDEDRNINSRSSETISGDEIPYIIVGSPRTLGSEYVKIITPISTVVDSITSSGTATVLLEPNTGAIVMNVTWNYPTEMELGLVHSYINYDFIGLSGTSGTFYVGDNTKTIEGLPNGVTYSSLAPHTNGTFTFTLDNTGQTANKSSTGVYFDVLSFGQKKTIADDTGIITSNVDRVNDAIYRLSLEETDSDTSKFAGTVEYIMINQLNVFDKNTYDRIETASKDVVMIVNSDMSGTDALRVSYSDISSTVSSDTISSQQDVSTHTGVIELSKTSYSAGNTVEVTLTDVDLNTDSQRIETYTTDRNKSWVGDANVWLSQLFVDGRAYNNDCSAVPGLGLSDTTFSFVETGSATGIFSGTLSLPDKYCTSDGKTAATNGKNLEFKYQDYNDASGKSNESTSKASIRSNTGSVSLDRTVYPVPFAVNSYAFHGATGTLNSENSLDAGIVKVTIAVNDPDFNLSASGTDTLNASYVTAQITRGSNTANVDVSGTLIETTPESGIFEITIDVEQKNDTFSGLVGDFTKLRQGDILSVVYKDPHDASGTKNSVTDSATFDMRNAVLQSDKSVYLIGSTAILTLIEPDLNLDSGSTESLTLNLINWDSDANSNINLAQDSIAKDAFSAQPVDLRETGDNTGIFQATIEIPKNIGTDNLERGEKITLEYTDNSPAGANFIGDDSEDVTVDIFTSNFGSSISLDQKVYTWTDKVYITIVAPDHNFDSNSIDTIGGTDKVLQVYTGDSKIKNYQLTETGIDTGIFTGEVILTGFAHDADGKTGDDNPTTPDVPIPAGPTDGYLQASNDDGFTVSFESSDGDTVIASSLIRWNIGEVQFLEASYPASGSGLIRVIDSDMNWNPESVDSFDVKVWSDSTRAGINLRVTETNEATGIFEGTVYFTVTDASSGARLRVAEGDTVTAKYVDHTLPSPSSTADDLAITATTLIGTIVPPLERVPASNLKAVDSFGNSLSTIQSGQQVMITSEVTNTQNKAQKFAYLLQVQDKNGVTVSLSWIDGQLEPNQTMNPAVSWIPDKLGEYAATVFVWESVNNPTALSPPVTTTLKVNS